MTEVLFGLDIPTSAEAGADPVGRARAAEAAGFDFVSASDHPCGGEPSYETWTMLSWIAASTSRIRVATRVLGVPYRQPAMVAKAAETLDRLSAGRLILGLGGGASDDEFRAFGIPARSPRDKVDGLAEAIRITRGLWTRPEFTFDGRLYHTDAARIAPKPAHHIPIWLGTFGNRALAVTGRLADGWIPSLGHAPPERIPAMRERVLAGARDAGRAPEEITLAYNLEVNLDDHALPDPSVLSGSPELIADRLIGFIGLGFTAFNLKLVGPDSVTQIDRLATEVIPAVKWAGERGQGGRSRGGDHESAVPDPVL
jgi:alkanesulfonate monooxygenase SsuD/methylene tetrahydromethanopterin reductase-like flavin-dependent oxidoreductase (luciferase family)